MTKPKTKEQKQQKLSRATTDTIRWYLQEIGKTPLLTAEEEVELAQAIQRGIVEGASDREKFLARRAKERMIKANLRLVVTVAKKYNHRGMEFLDLVQEGALGLERATEKFDATKGFKFSTYAYWWIRQSITRAIAQQSRAIRLPIHVTESLNQLKKMQRQASQQKGDKPLSHKVAEEYLALPLKSLGNSEIRAVWQKFHEGKITKESAIEGITLAVGRLKAKAREIHSLNRKSGKENDLELEQLLASDINIQADVEQSLARDEVRHAIAKLNPRSQDVIRMRFGLDDGVDRSLKEIGDTLELSRERVRQIEAKALLHLKPRLLKLKATL